MWGMRYIGAILISLCATVVVLSGGPANADTKQRLAAPTSAPKTQIANGSCFVNGRTAPSYGSAAPTVAPHPVSVTVVWSPGLNDKACKAVITEGQGRTASDLAQDIDSARFVPDGIGYSCPFDDYTSAQLYFEYGQHAAVERIGAQLGGCSWISSTGSGTRESSGQFRSDLATLAPSTWRSYLAN
jgi:hypothetical protein